MTYDHFAQYYGYMSIRNPQQIDNTRNNEPGTELFPAGFVFDLITDDFDEIVAIAPNWDHEHMKLGQGPCKGRLHAIHTARLQIATASWKPGIISRGSAPKRAITLAMLLRKTGPASSQGAVFERDQMTLLQPGQEFEFSAVGSCKLLVVVVREELFRSYTLARYGELSLPKDNRDRLLLGPMSHPAAVSLMWEGLLDDISRHKSTLSDSVSARSVEEQVIQRLLSRVLMGAAPPPGPNRHLVAKKAKDFIFAHADDPLLITDVCRAVGAHERTLLLAFNEVFGMPPQAYLKCFRLNRARQRLLGASKDETVTDIAIRCGFTHLSRFSADYRKMFGEYPRHTLIAKAGFHQKDNLME